MRMVTWVDNSSSNMNNSLGKVGKKIGFPGSSDGKNPHAVQETWVPSLGWEDPLE